MIQKARNHLEVLMPLIAVTVASPHKHMPEKGRIAAEVSRLSSTILRKDPKVTAVIVTIVPPEDWFCAGRWLKLTLRASGSIFTSLTGVTPRTKKRHLSLLPIGR